MKGKPVCKGSAYVYITRCPYLNTKCKKLVPGDKLIEFTPEKEGKITYTCRMGITSSTIKAESETTKDIIKDIIKGIMEDIAKADG